MPTNHECYYTYVLWFTPKIFSVSPSITCHRSIWSGLLRDNHGPCKSQAFHTKIKNKHSMTTGWMAAQCKTPTRPEPPACAGEPAPRPTTPDCRAAAPQSLSDAECPPTPRPRRPDPPGRCGRCWRPAGGGRAQGGRGPYPEGMRSGGSRWHSRGGRGGGGGLCPVLKVVRDLDAVIVLEPGESLKKQTDFL